MSLDASESTIVETVEGYGPIYTRRFEYAAVGEIEELHESVAEAVEGFLRDELYGEPPEHWPDSVLVDLYVPHEVTEKRVDDVTKFLLKKLQEHLDEDEELGHPEDSVKFENPEKAEAAMREAVGFCMRDRPIFYSRVVGTIDVEVKPWVRANHPSWFRPTGSMQR